MAGSHGAALLPNCPEESQSLSIFRVARSIFLRGSPPWVNSHTARAECSGPSILTTTQHPMSPSFRSKLGLVASLVLAVTGLCLLAIPIYAPEAFGVHGRWVEPSNYYFAALAAGITSSMVAAGFTRPENKVAKRGRVAMVAIGILVALLAAVIVVWVAMMSFAMGLS